MDILKSTYLAYDIYSLLANSLSLITYARMIHLRSRICHQVSSLTLCLVTVQRIMFLINYFDDGLESQRLNTVLAIVVGVNLSVEILLHYCYSPYYIISYIYLIGMTVLMKYKPEERMLTIYLSAFTLVPQIIYNILCVVRDRFYIPYYLTVIITTGLYFIILEFPDNQIVKWDTNDSESGQYIGPIWSMVYFLSILVAGGWIAYFTRGRRQARIHRIDLRVPEMPGNYVLLREEETLNHSVRVQDVTDSTVIGSEECAICLDKMKSEEAKPIGVTGCGHSFHKDCLQHWVNIKAYCPLCRSALKRIDQ